MDFQKIVRELGKKYPGKVIILNDKKNPTEVLCEVEPANEHPEYSLAISVIDKSIPHFHKKTTEIYKIVKGELLLFVGDQPHRLKTGDKFTIKPNSKHWSEGSETWVECYSEPGWTPEDNILVIDKKKISRKRYII